MHFLFQEIWFVAAAATEHPIFHTVCLDDINRCKTPGNLWAPLFGIQASFLTMGLGTNTKNV